MQKNLSAATAAVTDGHWPCILYDMAHWEIRYIRFMTIWSFCNSIVLLTSMHSYFKTPYSTHQVVAVWVKKKILQNFFYIYIYIKVQCSRYRPSVAQRMGRGIALQFHDRGTRMGCVVSSTPQPHFTLRKTRYPFYRRVGGPQIPDHPARSQPLYRLSYPAHHIIYIYIYVTF